MSDIKLDFQPSKQNSTKGTLLVYSGDDTAPVDSDTLDIANKKQRTTFIKRVTEQCEGIPHEDLERAILEQVGRIVSANRKSEEKVEADPLETTPQAVKDAALAMLKRVDLFEQISNDIDNIGIAGEGQLRVMLYVIMTSRLLDKPLSAIVQGASASGKSYIIETVAKLMPPEAVKQSHDFSEQALYYLPKGSLIHKAVISGERLNEHRGKDGYAADNSKAFREMVGSGELRKTVTIKGPDGKWTTETIHQKGPISFLESSTAANIHDEDATRLLPLITDESAEQTERIIEAQRREVKGQTISEAMRQEIILRQYTMQRLLDSVAVRIPYIDSISLPLTTLATRRTYEHFTSAIKSVALLRQFQKQKRRDEETGQEFIEADQIDYEIAYRLMQTVLARKYARLNQQSRDLLQTLVEKTSNGETQGYTEFTRRDCEGWTRRCGSRGSVRGQCDRSCRHSRHRACGYTPGQRTIPPRERRSCPMAGRCP